MTVSELLAMGTPTDRSPVRTVAPGLHRLGHGPGVRDAIAASCSGVEAADVLGFAGAGKAIFWAMQLFVDPGDHVIVTAPNYQSIESIPRWPSGVEVSGLPLWTGAGADLRWTPTWIGSSRCFDRTPPRVGELPNNPTGFVPDHDTWRAFNELCHERWCSGRERRGVSRCRDGPADTLPAAVEINPRRTVDQRDVEGPWTAGGYASLDREPRPRCADSPGTRQAPTSICNAGPSEHLTALALRNGPAILERNRQIIATNDRLVTDVLGGHPELFDLLTAREDAGLPRYLDDDGVESFCRRAVEESTASVIAVVGLPVCDRRRADRPFPYRHRSGLSNGSGPEALQVVDQRPESSWHRSCRS